MSSKKERGHVFRQLIDAVNRNEYKLSSGKNVMEFPFYIRLGQSVYDGYKEFLGTYLKLLNNENSNSKYSEAIEIVTKIGSGILETLEHHQRGEIFTSYQSFENTFEGINIFANMETSLKVDTTFYRMRADGGLTSAKDFYPIPSDKIYLSKSERFSIAGYPCLYLGYSKRVCELEITKGSVAKFALTKPIEKILDLTLGQGEGEHFLTEMELVKLFPLITACYMVPFYSSIKEEENRPDKCFFREEYIIPQLLTTYVKEKLNCKGIIYYTVKDSGLKTDGRGEEDYRNLVLFTNRIEDPNDENIMSCFDIKL